MLKDLLDCYQAPTLDEVAYKMFMSKFLDNYPDSFERSCFPGHFTASAWLLSKDRKKALLMHHKKLNIWIQTGGHCDGDQDVLNVAIKEAQEESGIKDIIPLSNSIFDIDIHTIPERGKEPEHLHLDIRFLLGVNSDEDYIKNDESFDLRWLSIHDNDYPPSVQRMVEKWRKLSSVTLYDAV